jgi:hypothetical protein
VCTAGDISKSGPKIGLVTYTPDIAESLIELGRCT